MTPSFDLPIYVARVEIRSHAWLKPTRYLVHRFGPIPAATVEWNEGRCRTTNHGCLAPAFIVRVPAGSGAERADTVSSGNVQQEWLRWPGGTGKDGTVAPGWLRWPGGRKSDEWDAQKVLHAAWMGWCGLSVDLGPTSAWTEPEVRAWPSFERGGLNAPPAVQPPPPLIDTFAAKPGGVQDRVQDGVQVEAHVPAHVPAHVEPPKPTRKPLVVEWGPPPVGPPPVGPLPKLSQMSMFADEPEAAGVGR